MIEKILETQREEKVEKVKKKILNEIDSLLKRYKAETAQTDFSMEDFEFVVKNSFILIKLRDYICNPASFNQMWNKGYIISDLHIDIWLQEDYTFAFKFLYNAEEHDYNIKSLLNDNFFELYFTNIVEEALYEQNYIK